MPLSALFVIILSSAPPLETQVADILGQLHAKGYVHRDVSAMNIILHNREPLLIDLSTVMKHRVSLNRILTAGVLSTCMLFISFCSMA